MTVFVLMLTLIPPSGVAQVVNPGLHTSELTYCLEQGTRKGAAFLLHPDVAQVRTFCVKATLDVFGVEE